MEERLSYRKFRERGKPGWKHPGKAAEACWFKLPQVSRTACFWGNVAVAIAWKGLGA